MKKIGIIIVNYKDYAEKFLDECVQSLRGQEAPDFEWELYIIDNASSEDSVKFLKEHAPEVIVIPRQDGNYSAANAAGIERAKKDGCGYYVIANMDVKFFQGWLKELVKAVDSGDMVGIAQSKILLHPRSEEERKNPKINSLGNVLNFLGFGYTKGYGEPDEGVGQEVQEIKGYASGCSMIIKKEVIAKIGNYDAQYYIYHDDVELCWRAKLAGYKIVLAPKSIVYHKYEFQRSIKMLYYMERNRQLAVLSFYKLPTLILLWPALLAMDMGIGFFSIINGWFLIKLKAGWYFMKLSSWKHILKARKKVREYRVVSDREILKSMSGKVEYQEVMNPVLKYIANPMFNLYFKVVKGIIWW